MSFAAERAQGLAGASPSDLAEIEITPSGYGLHWPKLDADLWLPALLEGVFGSRVWMAARLGAEGGKVTSDAKAAAARENGKRGGRPPKRTAARKAARNRRREPNGCRERNRRQAREHAAVKSKSKTATHLAMIGARRKKATAKGRPAKAKA